MSLFIVALFVSSPKRVGALLMSCVPCEITGGATTSAKKITKAITEVKIMVTAVARDILRRRRASTAGLRPVAKKRAIKIRINICETLASARIKTIAVNAPSVATKPK